MNGKLNNLLRGKRISDFNIDTKKNVIEVPIRAYANISALL